MDAVVRNPQRDTGEFIYYLGFRDNISDPDINRQKFLYVPTRFSYCSACEAVKLVTTLKKLLLICVSIEFKRVTYLLTCYLAFTSLTL